MIVLDQWTPELADSLGEFYRDLHRHPELAFHEHRTAAAVVSALRPLELDITTGVGGTGVVAVLHNGSGPVIMVRADMDALPVAEATGLPYSSATDGVAHACGHDMHTACLVGALHLLAGGREEWSGTVVAVFQPAEELARGARAMINDGLFDRFPRPSVILGQHVGPLPAGTIGYGTGPLMAGADSVQVTMFGRGGHAAWPEVAVDPVVMAASVVVRLQTVVAREVSSHDRAALTIGRMHAGDKDNVIPDTAELGINIRHYARDTRDHLRAAIERVIRAEASASAAPREPEFDWNISAPVLVSDPEATTATVSVFRKHFGDGSVFELPPIAASEDVGAFGQKISAPTVFWFFGGVGEHAIAEAARTGKAVPFNHSPQYAPVIEPTLTTGVTALVLGALTWLE